MTLSALGCSSDEAFLSLAGLCTERATDVCAARNGGCCAPTEREACEQAEAQRCMVEVDLLTAEPSRNYDAVAAARQGQAARAVLNACGSPPELATYFEDGLPLGSACERGAQCASGSCTGLPQTCGQLPATPLCP